MTRFNTDYAYWKSWDNLFACSEIDENYFKGEFDGIPLSGCRIFEIGFGAGKFIKWAADQGANVSGCELIPDLVTAGSEKGFKLFYGDAELVLGSHESKFDIIVAFDVLEHIETTQLPHFLETIHHRLADQGLLIARFPNGQSPFGRIYQHGDITHINILSKNKIEQLANLTHFKVERVSNAFRVASPNAGYWGYRDHIRFFVRDLIHKLISFAYDIKHMPLDPNIVVALRKQ